jgi:hypothetical protein
MVPALGLVLVLVAGSNMNWVLDHNLDLGHDLTLGYGAAEWIELRSRRLGISIPM